MDNDMSTEYCQNRLCHYKDTTDRIRAKKSEAPYYMNKKVRGYFNLFCSQGCMHEYFEMYSDRILTHIGEQGKRTRKATDLGPWASWQQQPEYQLDWSNGYGEAKDRYYRTWTMEHVGIDRQS